MTEVASVLHILEQVSTDIELDVAKHDGQPVTGASIAQMHGELSACVQALANGVIAIARSQQQALEALQQENDLLKRSLSDMTQKCNNRWSQVSGHRHWVRGVESDAWYG